MNPERNFALARARYEELAAEAAAVRRPSLGDPIQSPPEPLLAGLTLRFATQGDRPALARLAELDQAEPPAEPMLIGVVTERPVAALSLSDGRVVADPFFRTTELVELLRLRAAQLGRRERHFALRGGR